MALTESSAVDKIEVLEAGQIQVRRADKVFRDGKEISVNYHRHVLAPGDDLTNQDAKVKLHAELAWTPEIIAAHKARIKESKPA
jgi:predicted component of type VI protein secretion system